MPTKWLQERHNGSKNDDGMPPGRASRGTVLSAYVNLPGRNEVLELVWSKCGHVLTNLFTHFKLGARKFATPNDLYQLYSSKRVEMIETTFIKRLHLKCDEQRGEHQDSREGCRKASSVKRQASSVKRQASSVKRQASSVKRQPSTINRQPSTVNRQPSTVSRQPSTVNRQPSTVNHR